MRTLIVAAFAALIFVWLAFAVVNGQTFGFDRSVREAVHSFAVPALTRVMLALTFIGTTGFIAIVGAAFVWWLIKTSRLRDAIWLIALQISAHLVLQILQFAFHRARPDPFFGLAKPTSYSFPSGHALLSTVFYLSLAILMTGRLAVRMGAALLALFIGLSRVYLGVHYPSDVLAGFAAGVFWLSVWLSSPKVFPCVR
jgi:undecaprenyl-diphosphatase